MLKHSLRYWSAVSSGDVPTVAWAGLRTLVDTPASQVKDWLEEGWHGRVICCWRSSSEVPLLELLPHAGQDSLPLSCWHRRRAVAPQGSSVTVLSGAQKAEPWLGRKVNAAGGLTAGHSPPLLAPDLKFFKNIHYYYVYNYLKLITWIHYILYQDELVMLTIFTWSGITTTTKKQSFTTASLTDLVCWMKSGMLSLYFLKKNYTLSDLNIKST